MAEKLLKLRKTIKSKRPTLRRQDSHKKAAIKKSGWRKPRGLQNKVRLHKKGYVKNIQYGYSSPNAVKGLDAQGLKPVLVATIKELESINVKEESAIISGKLGSKKKELLLNKAKELKVVLSNIKDVDAAIAKMTTSMKDKKAVQKAKEAQKAKKKKNIEETVKAEKAKEKKEEAAEKSEEELKKEAEKEKQKVLTKKDN